MLLKIGELAKRTGLTVRTLHHYDDIGLLTPSARSDGGYRLYDREDVAKLHRIQCLRRLDISLAEVQAILAGGGARLPDVIEQQIAALDRQIGQAVELRTRLGQLQERLAKKDEPDLDEWLTTLEIMATYAKYFTNDELTKLRAHQERITETDESEQIELIAAIRSLIERDIPPESAEAGTVVRRWMELTHITVGGDSNLLLKLHDMHQNEPALQMLTGIDQPVLDYISRAMHVAHLEIYAKYFQPEEMEHLRNNYDERTKHWQPLIAAVRQQMEQNAKPDSSEVQALAHRWLALARINTGGDPQMRMKFRAAFMNEPVLQADTGIDTAVLAFIDRAISQLQPE